MTDNRTTELREKLRELGIEFATDDFDHLLTTIWWVDGIFAKYLEGTSKGCWCEDDPTLKIRMKRITPEQAIAATLGNERDEIYNAGFDNGVKVCLQILDGYLDYPHSAVENISKWVDEQWKAYGA